MQIIRALAIVLMLATLSYGANSLVIQSKEFAANATNQTVGILVTNDVEVGIMVIPLEIRTLIGGAFPATTMTIDLSNRFADWSDPEASSNSQETIRYYKVKGVPSNYNPSECGQDSAGLNWQVSGTYNFISPHAMLGSWIGSDVPTIASGNDGATPSVVITMGIGPGHGKFVIDSTCIKPGNTLLLTDASFNTLSLSFTSGEISVGCPCHTDPNCDDTRDILDVLTIFSAAFLGRDKIDDPNVNCLYNRTDVNCDGVTNSTDVKQMHDVVFNGKSPSDVFNYNCP